MRHLKDRRKLNRNAAHRLALMRNLTRALVEHGRIITTVAKAKEARRFVEKLITIAKKGNAAKTAAQKLHFRRLAMTWLPDKDTIDQMFRELGPRFEDRPGGYTRVIKRHQRRLGDAGHTAFLELLKEGETKKQKKKAPVAPAPKVESAPAAKKTEEKPEESKKE